MSLRNEFRWPKSGLLHNDKYAYHWDSWYRFIRTTAEAVYKANRGPLIVLSGLNYALTMRAVVGGHHLWPLREKSSFDHFEGYPHKLVIELHNYDTTVHSCDELNSKLHKAGAKAMDPEDETTVNVYPVLITEFGFHQTHYKSVYSTCLAESLPRHTAGWILWVLVGSCYIREGVTN